MDDLIDDIIRHWLILKRLYEDILDGLNLNLKTLISVGTVKIVIICIFQNLFIHF